MSLYCPYVVFTLICLSGEFFFYEIKGKVRYDLLVLLISIDKFQFGLRLLFIADIQFFTSVKLFGLKRLMYH